LSELIHQLEKRLNEKSELHYIDGLKEVSPLLQLQEINVNLVTSKELRVSIPVVAQRVGSAIPFQEFERNSVRFA